MHKNINYSAGYHNQSFKQPKLPTIAEYTIYIIKIE